MNITYLIGNGFDLHLGMKTSPRDFLQNFIEENKNSANRAASELARTIQSEGIETWADFEMQLGKHSSHFINTESSINEYLEQVEALEVGLHQWLSKEDEKVTDDFLKGIAPKLFSSFANVEQILKNDGVRVQAHATGGDTLSFLCFNYTSAFSRAWRFAAAGAPLAARGRLFGLRPPVSPHGTLDTFLVCGVDGKDQISNVDYQDNEDVTASIVKTDMQRSDSFDFDLDSFNIISGSDIVCVFGMSLGRSDRRWWSHIASSLNIPTSPLSQLVVFWHGLNGVNLSTPPSRHRERNKIKNAFIEAAEIPNHVADNIRTSIQAFPTSVLLSDNV